MENQFVEMPVDYQPLGTPSSKRDKTIEQLEELRKNLNTELRLQVPRMSHLVGSVSLAFLGTMAAFTYFLLDKQIKPLTAVAIGFVFATGVGVFRVMAYGSHMHAAEQFNSLESFRKVMSRSKEELKHFDNQSYLKQTWNVVYPFRSKHVIKFASLEVQLATLDRKI